MILSIAVIIVAVITVPLCVYAVIAIRRIYENYDTHVVWLKNKHNLDLRAVAQHANTSSEEGRPYPGTLAVRTLYPGFDFTIGGELDDVPGADLEHRVKAPFTDEQVRSLNDYQTNSIFHAFTCGSGSDHGPLLARPDGMVCQGAGCSYRQEWVNRFMADHSWRVSQEDVLRHIRAAQAPQ